MSSKPDKTPEGDHHHSEEASDESPPLNDDEQANGPDSIPAVLRDRPHEEIEQFADYISARVIEQITVSASKTSIFAGPLPPPEVLERYETLYPGAAEQLFVSLQEESRHRRQLENHLVKHESLQTYLGQFLGFIIVLSVIGLAAFAINSDYEVEGVILAIAALSALVGVFVYRSRSGKDALTESSDSTSD